MDFTKTLFDVIDMRSFSSIWYWIVLAVAWSSASHYVIGVPFDLIQRAKRHGGQAEADLHDLVRINVNRLIHISEVTGALLLAFLCFVITALAMLGFWYRIQLAQGLVMLLLPLSIVGMMSIATARRIASEEPEGVLLYKRLLRHRFWTQTIGMISIFITAIYGMYRNLAVIPGY